MEGCFTVQHTCQEEDNRVGGVGMELEEFLDGFLNMERNCIRLILIQYKCRNT